MIIRHYHYQSWTWTVMDIINHGQYQQHTVFTDKRSILK